jgi:hypothetical protein
MIQQSKNCRSIAEQFTHRVKDSDKSSHGGVTKMAKSG